MVRLMTLAPGARATLKVLLNGLHGYRLVQPGEYADTTYSYSVLRTIQDGFGVGPYLGSAGQVARLPVVWK